MALQRDGPQYDNTSRTVADVALWGQRVDIASILAERKTREAYGVREFKKLVASLLWAEHAGALAAAVKWQPDGSPSTSPAASPYELPALEQVDK
jgi:hypothetical protein